MNTEVEKKHKISKVKSDSNNNKRKSKVTNFELTFITGNVGQKEKQIKRGLINTGQGCQPKEPQN